MSRAENSILVRAQVYADSAQFQDAITPDFITRQTFGISFYDSVEVFEKGDVWRKERLHTGGKSLLSRMFKK